MAEREALSFILLHVKAGDVLSNKAFCISNGAGHQAMAAFLIGTVRITAPEGFAAYAAAIKGLAAEFGGESVVAGPVAEVIEGDCKVGERIVVTRFPSAEQARAYIGSPRYIAARALREGAAEVELRLVLA